MSTIAQNAIQESFNENRIVHLSAVLGSPEWVAIDDVLWEAADDWTVTLTGEAVVKEYWGHGWRVHLTQKDQ